MDFGLFIVDEIIEPKFEMGDIAKDEGLETAVLISLYTDRRVTVAELPPNETDQGGWWADTFEQEGDGTGSKIWLLNKSKANDQTIAQMETYAAEALQWMIDDGVARSISIEASYDENKNLLLEISVTKPTGDEPNVYSLLWDGQNLKRE
jgi:phage gp46-like protein